MISIILFFLGKGIKAGNKLDLFIKESLEKLGDNYIVKISILNSKPCLCFWKENNKLYFKIGEKARKIKPDLEISFKNKKSARKVLFGAKSIEKAFANGSKTENLDELAEEVFKDYFDKSQEFSDQIKHSISDAEAYLKSLE